MSGHSKWSTIKRKKGAADAKRGKIFSRLNKEIMLAVKDSGPDPASNMRLKNAVDKAKEANMPSDTVERAIKRASGADADAANWEEITYEGYGPASVAIFVEALTDNKNRTAADVRHIFTKSGGKLGSSGSVAYLFSRKGMIQISKSNADEESIYEAAIEAGADNVDDGGEIWDIYTEYQEFDKVRSSLRDAGLPIENSELVMLPSTSVKISGRDAQNMLKMMEAFEDLDDVQNVWANFDIDIAEMEAFGE